MAGLAASVCAWSERGPVQRFASEARGPARPDPFLEGVESGRLNWPRGQSALRSMSTLVRMDSSAGPSDDAHRQRLGPRGFVRAALHCFIQSREPDVGGAPSKFSRGCPRCLLRYRSLALSHPRGDLAPSGCAWFERGRSNDAHRSRTANSRFGRVDSGRFNRPRGRCLALPSAQGSSRVCRTRAIGRRRGE
jgi:hypothetical protein